MKRKLKSVTFSFLSVCLLGLSIILYKPAKAIVESSSGKTHVCEWIITSPTSGVVKCEGTGSMCGVGRDCVKSE